MSLVSSNRRRRKTVVRKKPVWDDTLNDLSVYKPSMQELVQRHVAHKSKNHMSVKLEKMRKAKQKQSGMSIAEARQMAIMKEVLYDQQQLQDTLSKSDQMMAVVKSLFEDPKRFMGYPEMTSIPKAGGEQTRSGNIVAPVKDLQTKSDTLSESIMDQVALNDLTDTSDDGEAAEPIVYQPQMNLQRFQQFLAAEEERNQTLSSIGGQAQLSQNELGPVHSTRLQTTQDTNDCVTPRRSHNESIEMLRTPRSAINDTRKVKKTKKMVMPEKENIPQTTSTLNLTDMRKVLGNLENEIEQYEKQTGRQPAAEKQRSETFSGYTVALVDSVYKLATYLKETDLRLQAETTVREQLTQDVYQLRNIVDSLTSDIIMTQEEYSKVYTDFERYRAETREEISSLKLAFKESCRSNPEPYAGENLSSNMPNKSSHPTQYHPDIQRTSDQEASHAVVLSPPVRKTRVTDGVDPQPSQSQPTQSTNQQRPTKRQTSLIDLANLSESFPLNYKYPPPQSLRQRHAQHIETVSVPRPTPLVQSNIPGVPMSSEEPPYQQNSIPTSALPTSVSGPGLQSSVPVAGLQSSVPVAGLQSSMSMAGPTVQTASSSTAQSSLPMSEQIAELNRQHEEAQKRLQLLFKQQERQHMEMVVQQQQKYHQQPCRPQQQQEQPYRLQQEQQQQQLYRPQQQQQPYRPQQQQAVTSDVPPAMNRPNLGQGDHCFDNRNTNQNCSYQPQSDTPPRTYPAQSRLQDPVSPPISPISLRSDNLSVLQQLQDRQRQCEGGKGREITVSLPVMDLDMSGGSLPSPQH